MTVFADYLQTDQPLTLPFSADIQPPGDPVSWGLDIFRANPAESAIQVTETDARGEQHTQYIDEQNPANIERFANGITGGQAVHGRIALVDFCAGEGSVRDSADWAWEAFNAHFMRPLHQRHPMGFYMKAMLWMSCGEHCYAAHNDLADGFLMHMQGSKRVRVWPLPESCRSPIVFKHGNFEERMASEPVDFELEPGQVLFIPSGAMHEVVAQGEEPCVSVSFHMGSPIALPIFCAQLNKLVEGGGDIMLPYDMTGLDKFTLYFFEPTRFLDDSPESREAMPEELAQALLPLLISKRIDKSLMRELVSLWWRVALTHPIYLGPYPPTQ